MPDASSPDTAVLLVNLGTPDAPTPRAVRCFLSEFLHDHRVVSLTRWLWCPILHFAILPLRGRAVAHKYAAIWLPGPDGGSPLAVYTRRLARGLQAVLPRRRVAHAMRYRTPAIADALRELQAGGVSRALVLPLYPQYSTTTTASVEDALARAGVDGLQLRVLRDYHLAPEWIAAVAESIRAHWRTHGRGEHLLLTWHGLPQRLADQGDPYPDQCEASSRAIAQALGLADEAWSLSYQSRFGRERWLEPATDATLRALLERGVRTIDAVAPGFAVDCLETLEEVSMLLAGEVAARGGELRYIACLNDAPAHAAALAAIAERELGAWT